MEVVSRRTGGVKSRVGVELTQWASLFENSHNDVHLGDDKDGEKNQRSEQVERVEAV